MLRLVLSIALLLSFAFAQAPQAPQSPSAGRRAAAPKPAARSLLRSGPMPAYAEMTETVIWLQTTAPARVQLRYNAVPAPPPATPPPANQPPQVGAPTSGTTAPIQTTAAGDHIARVVISGLEPGTRYEYQVLINGAPVALPYKTYFQTQPIWRWRGSPPSTPPNFKFAVGSCAYINDPPYDRPGTPYGSGYEIFDAIAATEPAFMLWVGDNFYYREADWLTESAMRYRVAHNRALPELQRLLSSTHHYATWDDHDYGPNDSDSSFRLRDAALRIFSEYFPAVVYGTPELRGVFQRFEWADVEFFLLDDRYYRSPNRMPPGPDKRMLGAAQMDWLKRSLRSSNARFKIIVNGNQVLNPHSRDESFAHFPEEQRELLDFIRNARVTGVLFLSGDRHMAEIIRVDQDGMYPLFDITTSPLTAGLGSRLHPTEQNNPVRVPGTLVDKTKNFALIEVTGPRDDRRLTVRLLGPDRSELWRHEIAARELQFPQPPQPAPNSP